MRCVRQALARVVIKAFFTYDYDEDGYHLKPYFILMSWLITMVTGAFNPRYSNMSFFNITFSMLEKFTDDGEINLQQWFRNFDKCCVIGEKSDDLKSLGP